MSKLTFVLLCGLAACSNAKKPAQLEVQQRTIALGTIAKDTTCLLQYQLENTGGSELQVDTVSASCGCTVPEQTSFRLAPNEKHTLVLRFQPPDTGAFNKKVVVRSNTDSLYTILSFNGYARK